MSIVTKTCNKCGQQKPATSSYFHRGNDPKDGLSYRCKACNAEHSRQWNAENRKHKTDLQKAWRESHPGYVAEKSRNARETHPGRDAVLARKSRARKLNAQGSHSIQDVATQYDAQHGECFYCKNAVGDEYHVDHVIPLSRGGSNNANNLAIACPPCNRSKANKLPFEWVDIGATT